MEPWGMYLGQNELPQRDPTQRVKELAALILWQILSQELGDPAGMGLVPDRQRSMWSPQGTGGTWSMPYVQPLERR